MSMSGGRHNKLKLLIKGGLPPPFFKVHKHSTTTSYNLLAQVVVSDIDLIFGRWGDPSHRVSGAPPAPPRRPGIRPGGVRRDRPIQMNSLGNSYAPAPCPVSHLHAAAAVRAGSGLRLLKSINTKMRSLKRGSAILRFTNPKVQPKVISLIVFIDLDNLRHRFRPNGGRGMDMRHGARRRGVTIAE